ncbi:cerebellin-3-like isoform X2 [Conger conger]|uniref:cerebellin-3-like isoform X2 n=1 Tax=Conger conger TaxID=82655 RepID=UPI002A59C8A1|nr:cerebellin-3-like isoform X2 [Conger conger]
MYTNDKPPRVTAFMDNIPETENTYSSINDHVYTCLDKTAPSNRSTEPKSSAGRRSLDRKASLIFVSLWLITLITLIVGLVLYCGQRSAIQSELEALEHWETSMVAFSASLVNHSETIRLGPHSEDVILVYRHVITNVGSAYNPSSGIFTAPTKGVYYFSFTAFGWSENPAQVSLYLNHKYFMSAYDNKPGPGRGTANMITLQLDIGDILYIKLRSNMQLHDNGNLYNTFSGHLLFPISLTGNI